MTADLNRIVLGTRGSELARVQTQAVTTELRRQWPDLDVEMKVIRTSGDDTGNPVDARAGRKGLFTAEIERALVNGEVDLAVHSAKDLPSELGKGTKIAAVLARAAVEDVLVATVPCHVESIRQNGIVATSSVRRKHQLGWKRPDLEIVDLRGNVPTRLRKLAKSEWQGIILARAGLDRLGLTKQPDRVEFEGNEFSLTVLPQQVFLPAGGQGVIALQVRDGDDGVKMLAKAVNHFESQVCLEAEREFLRLLQADCNQPVGVLARVEGTIMSLRGQIFDLGAVVPREASVKGKSEDVRCLAAELLERINGS